MTFWELFIGSLPRVPWRGFIFGLFLPLLLMQIGGAADRMLLGVIAALVECTAFFVVDSWRTKMVSVFPLFTFFMIATQFAAGWLSAAHPSWAGILAFVPTIDNLAIAAVFLGSLATKTPLILAILDQHSLNAIPEKIRSSSYYIRGWQFVTLVWGLLYVATSVIILALRHSDIPGAAFIEYLLGWPIVPPFLVLSVMIPRWYWTKNAISIERENQVRAAADSA